MSILRSLRFSTLAQEPPFQAAKWLKCQVLLDGDEMSALLDALEGMAIYRAGCITERGAGHLEKEDFLACYRVYIAALKEGILPNESLYRSIFSCIFTAAPELLYAVPVGEEQQLIRICKPVIQLQAHYMDYSHADGKFRPMILGVDSILWGIQFSYPQLYQAGPTQPPQQVEMNAAFPDTRLFRALQRWVRHNTIPTPFLVGANKINVPMRLGKKCLEWINCHPQLIKKGLQVSV